MYKSMVEKREPRIRKARKLLFKALTRLFMNYLQMSEHVVFPSEIFEADGTREHFHVDFVGRHVMPAEIADVGVNPIADGAAIQIIFLPHAKVPRRFVGIADLLCVVLVPSRFDIIERRIV